MPIKILNKNIELTLLDSLNKRLIFLEEVVNNLKLDNIKVQHDRAEDAGVKKQFREKFDIAVSRAVAPLNVLVEYLLPFVRVGGKVFCMKASNLKEELEQAKNAIKILGGEIEEEKEFVLPNSNIKRTIIIIKKIKNTPNKYPRRAGTPTKQPLLK